jgi:hypothetical protein
MPLQMSKPLVALTHTLIIAPLSPDTGLSRGGVIIHHNFHFYTTDPYQSSSHTRGGVTKPQKLVAPQTFYDSSRIVLTDLEQSLLEKTSTSRVSSHCFTRTLTRQ